MNASLLGVQFVLGRFVCPVGDDGTGKEEEPNSTTRYRVETVVVETRVGVGHSTLAARAPTAREHWSHRQPWLKQLPMRTPLHVL